MFKGELDNNNRLIIPCKVCEKAYNGLIDTGSKCSGLSQSIIEENKLPINSAMRVKGVNSCMDTWAVEVDLTIEKINLDVYKLQAFMLQSVVNDFDILLGMDFLINCDLMISKGKFTIKKARN